MLWHARIFSCSLRTLGMWDPVPWPGMEPRLPAWGAWSPSHWTTREVPIKYILTEGQESRKPARMSGFCRWSLQKYWGQGWRVDGKWTVPDFGNSSQVSGSGPPPYLPPSTQLMASSQLPGGGFIQAWAHALTIVMGLEMGIWFNLVGLKFFTSGWWGMGGERIVTEKLVFYWSQWSDRSPVLLGPHCGGKKLIVKESQRRS